MANEKVTEKAALAAAATLKEWCSQHTVKEWCSPYTKMCESSEGICIFYGPTGCVLHSDCPVKWIIPHRKTYKEDILEKYPNTLLGSSGEPRPCRNALYKIVCWTAKPKAPKEPYRRALVWIHCIFPDRRRRDIGNIEKFVTDGLVLAGVIKDDAFQNIELRLTGETIAGQRKTIIAVEEKTR